MIEDDRRTGGTPCLDGRRQPSLGWHEPDEARVSRPDLWEARGEIPRAYPATGNRAMPNRTEATMRKLSSAATGRLKPLRLFSTLLPIVLIDSRLHCFQLLVVLFLPPRLGYASRPTF